MVKAPMASVRRRDPVYREADFRRRRSPGLDFQRRWTHQYWLGSSRTNASMAAVYWAVTQVTGSS